MSSGKIISKYYRIRFSDKIGELVRALPIRNLRETQVGNHVYSGSGFIKTESGTHHATLRIRLIESQPTVLVRCDALRIRVECDFDVRLAVSRTGEALRRTLS